MTAEANETFVVNLSAAAGATLFDAQGLGTILNDDGPVLRITDVARAEGHAGTTHSVFTVTLSPAASGPVTVNYATANGSAVAGSDYTATSGTLTFAPGQTSRAISVAVLGDTMVEANETFVVNLSAAVGATLFDAQGLGTILNDDTVGSTIELTGGGTEKSLQVADSQMGDVLLYPYWSTQEQDTLLTIGSVSGEHANGYVHVSLREGQHGQEVLGFTICLRAGEEWTAAVRSNGTGQAYVQVDKPGSCESTVPQMGFTSPPVAGQALPITADFGYVEAYSMASASSDAAELWGKATLLNSNGSASSYVATALVGLAAQDERATTAQNMVVAEALARAGGVDKEILLTQWTADSQSAERTQVVLTFPGGRQPGVEDPVSLYVFDGAEHGPVAWQQVTLPHVVNVCTLMHGQEGTVVQCPTAEGEAHGLTLLGPLGTFQDGWLWVIDNAEGEDVDSRDAPPVRRFPVLGMVISTFGGSEGFAHAFPMEWRAQIGAGRDAQAPGNHVHSHPVSDDVLPTPGEPQWRSLPLTGE